MLTFCINYYLAIDKVLLMC